MIDIVLAIDNSRSMTYMQEILLQAVPKLVGRLVRPLCVKEDSKSCMAPGDCASNYCIKAAGDAAGTCQAVLQTNPASPTDPNAKCDEAHGFKREFKPIRDIHIGTISSSLGNHAGRPFPDACPDQFND